VKTGSHSTGVALAWRAFAQALLGAATGIVLVLVALLVLLDPYDTGRLTPLPRSGVRDQAGVTAHASRIRDPSFDAAILGNSHVQALRPDRLSRLTGLSFVSLVMPGSRPREQIALLERYLSTAGQRTKAVVIGIDAWWCTADPNLPTSGRFPFWLYDPRWPAYVAGLVRYRSLEDAAAHLRFRVDPDDPARPDGFDDYEPVYVSLGAGDRQAVRRKLEARISLYEPNPSARFPSVERLAAVLDAAGAGHPPVVLVQPPVYPTALPEPGTAEAEVRQACRIAVARLGDRMGVRVVDWQERSEAADPEQYFNHDHYRDSLAQQVERSLADALRR
jgi:hypothetical protein